MDPKEKLIKEFQRNPDRYWKVKLFDDLGFDRKKCTNCGKFFWTCTKQIVCNDSSCRNYDFIGNPPTKSKFDYFETWNLIRKFFGKNDHAWINRYPVICRWLPDLNFVIAGIVDFMRVENGNSLFSLPANPLILLQPCLRFNDIINTGINGRSYTEFEMIQQTSSFDGKNGYWKDRCMELDYEMLTKVFGIPKQEIVFIEDVWVGPKAFGSSLEYHVQGLELGNAVFTEFEGTIESHRQMRNKIIDMGAGLNRFAWISNGTPTSYDVVFGDVTDKIKNKVGFSGNKDFFAKYSKLSGKINFGESNFEREREKVASDLKISLDQLEKNILPYQALYSIADHTRSLVFAISDSGIPSNVGGGHNLRVILRRALAFIERFKWDLNLEEVANWHIDYLKKMFPDLDEKREEISKILKVEESRYNSTKARASKIVEALTKQKIKPTYDELKTFYQSEGITPDQLISAGLEIKVPAEFYQKITEREGQHKKVEQNQEIDVRGLPETKKLYYQKPWIFKFTAKVIKVIDGNLVVLDQTAFYPTGGGQVHDKGTIDGSEVLEVQKIGNIIVHRVDKPVSGVVECAIDKLRREKVSKHHTATHIINAAARKVLGFHVWQNSAFKDENAIRLAARLEDARHG